MIRDVTDLEVYNESLKMIEEIYKLIRKFPKSEYDSVSQIKRAAKSVTANIGEGFAKRGSEKEFKRFLQIAIGSSDEVVTHFRTIYHAIPRLQGEVVELAQKYKVLSKRLNKLHSIWRSDKF